MQLSAVAKSLFRALIVDKSIPQGAATTLYACLEPSLADQALRGSFLVDCAIAQPKTKETQDVDGSARRALWAATEAQLQEALGASGKTTA